MSQKILTESGTNEAEFLEFGLGSQSFAINVAKIVQIIPFREEELTRTVGTPDSVLGSLLWRNQTIDLIDLKRTLNFTAEEDSERSIVLVTNFNNITSGFRIDGVTRIYRAGWDSIIPVDASLNKYSPRFTGMICIEERIVLLVDFEKIIFDLCPDTEEAVDLSALALKRKLKREDNQIVFAEDSTLIRTNISKILQRAGYKVFAFEDGQKAYDYITQIHQQFGDSEHGDDFPIDLLVTDIEMPQMDGLTLCRKVKKMETLSDLPVLIFSSLINEQMIVKCREVDANAYVTKPGSEDLINKIDEMLLI